MTDRFEQALFEAYEADVPPALTRRVAAEIAAAEIAAAEIAAAEIAATLAARPQAARRLRIAFAVFGVLLINHAAGNLLFPEAIADAIHGHYDGHLYREAGVATFGVGVLMLLAAFRSRLADAASAVAAPVGLGFGAIGLWELPRSLFGASVHLTEAAAAAAVIYFWWKSRYATQRLNEEEA